jgi:hypothetical protein
MLANLRVSFVIKKLPKVNDCSKGEISPNMVTLLPWWRSVVDIASASGIEDPGSNPASVQGFIENKAMLLFI